MANLLMVVWLVMYRRGSSSTPLLLCAVRIMAISPAGRRRTAGRRARMRGGVCRWSWHLQRNEYPHSSVCLAYEQRQSTSRQYSSATFINQVMAWSRRHHFYDGSQRNSGSNETHHVYREGFCQPKFTGVAAGQESAAIIKCNEVNTPRHLLSL